jgi:hypothetical protein
LIITVVCCNNQNPKLDKTEILYFENFENKENLNDWIIYENILGHKTAFIENDTTRGIGKCLSVKSYSFREMGHTANDFGRATKYLSSINGNGIYFLNLKMKCTDDGNPLIILQQIRSNKVIKSKFQYFNGLGGWSDYSIIDTLDVFSDDSLAIVLMKGSGFTVGENPVKFDSIELKKLN